MRRLILAAVLIASCAVTYVIFTGQPQHIALSNAQISAGHSADGPMMASLEIENTGPPDQLLAANVPSADLVMIMRSEDNLPMIIPAQSNALLAADGAHLMIDGLPAELEEGATVPLILTFKTAGEVSTRALIAAPGMNHGMSGPAPKGAGTPPSLALDAPLPLTEGGFSFGITATNFTFKQIDGMAPHVPGEGHAHYYLNGVKLGRLYSPQGRIAQLPPGNYVLRVSLNTNDHRPYQVEGKPVAVSVNFRVN